MIAPQVWHGGASCWLRNAWRGAASTGSGATRSGGGEGSARISALAAEPSSSLSSRVGLSNFNESHRKM